MNHVLNKSLATALALQLKAGYVNIETVRVEDGLEQRRNILAEDLFASTADFITKAKQAYKVFGLSRIPLQEMMYHRAMMSGVI